MKYLIEEYLNNLEKEARNSIQIAMDDYPVLLNAPASGIPFYYSRHQVPYTSTYYYPNMFFINATGDLCIQTDAEMVHVIGKLCEYEISD